MVFFLIANQSSVNPKLKNLSSAHTALATKHTKGCEELEMESRNWFDSVDDSVVPSVSPGDCATASSSAVIFEGVVSV